MVILGLGSNLGDRLSNLRSALRIIRALPDLTVTQVSPVYESDALVPEGASSDWNIPYYNLALRCETSLTPYDLLALTKEIEVKVGRVPNKKWGPRVIDIDLLAWDDLIQYDQKLHIPHEGLLERPFALWPVADVAPRWIYPLPGSHQGKTASELVSHWGSRFSGEAPFHTKQIQHRIDTPQLVGIINVTPDSFSDGGVVQTVEAALKKACCLLDAGATILDIGAEATGPRATPLTAEEEWSRLQPILKALTQEIKSGFTHTKISVDTRHANTAKKALNLGVDWINDVSGLSHPEMREVIRDTSCDVAVMHHLGIPVSQSGLLDFSENPTEAVFTWAQEKLAIFENEGISQERIIFDIGIGYGKTADQSLELIKQIQFFKSLGVRLLVGHSRKSFLQQFTHLHPAERDLETTILSIYLADKVDYLRVHNVELHSRAFKVAGAIQLSEQ